MRAMPPTYPESAATTRRVRRKAARAVRPNPPLGPRRVRVRQRSAMAP